MTLGMHQLNGFLRMGPQVYPQRPNAMQVIQRGPHGERLAADPVLTRDGRVRGSGFRVWSEERLFPQDAVMEIPQKVVGLMGLGQVDTALQAAWRYFFAAGPREWREPALRVCPDKPRIPLPGPSPSWNRSLYLGTEINKALDILCNGRPDGAKKTLDAAETKILPAIPAGERQEWAGHLRAAHAWIIRWAALGESNREARDQAVSDYQAGVRSYNVSPAATRARETSQKEIECAKKGSAAYALWTATGACPDAPIPPGLSDHWWKIALGVGAVVGVYALASGVGRGLVGRS